MKPSVKLATEFGPLALFFLTNLQFGLFPATAVLIGATILSIIISYSLAKKVPGLPLLSCLFVCIFGGLTLIFEDEFFIKIKPTVIHLISAAILFIGLLFRKPLLKLLMGEAMALEDEGWLKLSFRWACFFVFMAGVNEFVWRSFDTDFWVTFKTIGMLPMTLIFAVAQMGLMKRYATPDSPFYEQKDAASDPLKDEKI